MNLLFMQVYDTVKYPPMGQMVTVTAEGTHCKS